jgi:hypothetical protein
MAELPRFFWDSAGHAHTNALYWEGFPRLLWESLQVFGYTEPPPYDGVEYDEEGVPRCRVKMIVPPHPTLSLWQPFEVNVIGHRLIDTFEAAAMEAIHIFCNQHPEEVAGYPIGLFPAMDSHDSTHCGQIGKSGRRDSKHCGQIHECTIPLPDTSAAWYISLDQHSPRVS